jgi:hypothetical protein
MRTRRSVSKVTIVLGLLVVLSITCIAVQTPKAGASVNWPLHNLDLAGTRYSTLDQINRSNVKTLTPRWLFQTGIIDGVSNQTTPIVVDRVMYVTDPRGSVYALDAAEGDLLWTFDATNLIGGGKEEGYIFRNRGVAYADGKVYTAAGSFLFALDAKTGKLVPGFGSNGKASVILDVIKARDPNAKTAISAGYWFTAAPQIYNGVVYVGTTRSESHIRGGYIMAVDAETGRVLWHFNTVPQDAKDQGWEIAGPTWVGGERNGGGVWETFSIDSQLGMLYVAVGNPWGDPPKRRRHESVYKLHRCAVAEDRRTEVAFPAGPSRCLGLRFSKSACSLRYAASRSDRQGARRGKQELLSLHSEPRDRPADHSIKEMPVPTANRASRRSAMADAAVPIRGIGQTHEPDMPCHSRRIPSGGVGEGQDRFDV